MREREARARERWAGAMWERVRTGEREMVKETAAGAMWERARSGERERVRERGAGSMWEGADRGETGLGDGGFRTWQRQGELVEGRPGGDRTRRGRGAKGA